MSLITSQFQKPSVSVLDYEPVCGEDEINGTHAECPIPSKRTFSLKKLFKNITVEPIMLCYLLPLTLSILASQNMDLEKACRVNLNYSSVVCNDMLNLKLENITQQVVEVQKVVAKIQAWVVPVGTAAPALMILFIGAWSDRNNNRKVCMLIPLAGAILTKVALLIGVYFFLELPLEYNALSQTIISVATGGRATFFMGCFAYISDVTSLEERTFRIGILSLFTTLAVSAGTSISGVLAMKMGYYGVFCLAIVIYAIGFVYGLIRIKVTPLQQAEGSQSGFYHFFAPSHVLDTLKVLYKKRSGSKRLILYLALTVTFFVIGPLFGEFQLIYMYTIKKFGFTPIDFSIFMSIWMLIGTLGTLAIISIFSKMLQFRDSSIGAFSAASSCLASLLFALAPTWQWFYVGTILDFGGKVSGTNIRSITTKIVNTDEIGKMTSLMGVLEALVPVIFSPLYSLVYANTIETLPGSFYLMSSGFFFFAAIIFVITYILEKRNIITTEDVDEIDAEDERSTLKTD